MGRTGPRLWGGGLFLYQPPLVVVDEKTEKYGCGMVQLSTSDIVENERSTVNGMHENQPKLKQSRKPSEKKRVWTKLSNGLYAWRMKCVPKKLSGDVMKSLRTEQSHPWAPAEINLLNTSNSIKPGSTEKRKCKDLDFGSSGRKMKKGKVEDSNLA